MKMKRIVIQISMDYPVNRNPWDYINITGGQLISNLKKETIKEEDLGDVDTPWSQKTREFYAVRRIIQDGVNAGIDDPKVSIVVSGTRWSGVYNYGFSISPKKVDGVYTSDYHMVRYNPISNLDVTCEKGTLKWDGPVSSQGYGRKTFATMSVGDPEISTRIAEFIKTRIRTR